MEHHQEDDAIRVLLGLVGLPDDLLQTLQTLVFLLFLTQEDLVHLLLHLKGHFILILFLFDVCALPFEFNGK